MDRRGFFRRAIGAIAAAVAAPFVPKALTLRQRLAAIPQEELAPIFQLQDLPLPIVYSDFWFPKHPTCRCTLAPAISPRE